MCAQQRIIETCAPALDFRAVNQDAAKQQLCADQAVTIAWVESCLVPTRLRFRDGAQRVWRLVAGGRSPERQNVFHDACRGVHIAE